MKHILKIAPKVAVASALAAVAIPIAVSAWGPASRPTYTIERPADKVVFNSITNNPDYGDERNFAHIKESGEGNGSYRNEITLTPGKVYDVFVYYHNNASTTYNTAEHNYKGIAQGAYARVEFPSTVKGSTPGNVYLGATNATPSMVWDTITFKSTEAVTLRYISGSAKLTNFSSTGTFNLSDNLFGSNGTLIGYDKMDGKLPGCNYYSGYITFQVTVDKSDFSLEKQVRLKGTTEWKENVTAKAGDIVEYQLTYRNTGNVNQMSVKIFDKLPSGLSYVAGSTKIKDGARPNGAVIADGITTNGLTIGNYAPGAAAYVIFSAKVTAKDTDLVCGENRINNIGKVTVGNNSKEDGASVTIEKDCPVVEMCDVPGKTHLPKDDPNCKEDQVEMCDIPGKTHLPKDDPSCKEDVIEMCDIPGKTHLKKDDPNCKEDQVEMCDVPGKTHLTKNDPDCYELPVTGATSIVSGILGVTSMATAGTYYVRSRKKLN